jgi:hypothetical protein
MLIFKAHSCCLFSLQHRMKNIESICNVIYDVMSSHKDLISEIIIKRTVSQTQAHFSRVSLSLPEC